MSVEGGSLLNITAQVQAVVKEIGKCGNGSQFDTHLEKLHYLIERVPVLDFSISEHKSVRSMLQASAVALWNIAVASKGSEITSSIQVATLRHASCKLLFLVCKECTDPETLKKQAMVGIKSGRAWLDCCNFDLAEEVLGYAMYALEQLMSRCLSTTTDAEKYKFQSEMLKTIIYKVEALFGKNEHEEALKLTQRARSSLPGHLSEGKILTAMCYNFGLSCYEKNNFAKAVNWLQESYALGKAIQMNSKDQARTLRLLATTYIEWDNKEYLQDATNAIGLANSEYAHPAGLFLKLRILLNNDKYDSPSVQFALKECICHPDLTLELGLETVCLCMQSGNTDLILLGLKQLEKRFPDSTKVHMMRLEHLLQLKEYNKAKCLISRCIEAHQSTKPLDIMSMKRLHMLLWQQANKCYEDNLYQDALLWYKYSLDIFGADRSEKENLAKLHRNLCSCYLALNDIEKAQMSLDEAVKLEDNPHTFYLLFRVALLQKNNLLVLEALQKLCSSKDPSTYDLICIASQLALDSNSSDIAIAALEGLANHANKPQQIVTTLRCLIRLRLSSQGGKPIQYKDILSYLKTAYNCFTSTFLETDPKARNEVIWFVKIAYNMGIQCDGDVNLLLEFFLVCIKLLSVYPLDAASNVKLKTCLVVAIAASIQMGKQTESEQEKRQYLNQALEMRTQCSKLCRELTASVATKDKTEALLLLYEFEAKSLLDNKASDLNDLLEKALAMPHANEKTFENIAALSIEYCDSIHHRELTLRALKAAIHKHLCNSKPDYSNISKLFRNIIHLSLKQGTCLVEAGEKSDVWQYFHQAADVVDKSKESEYPEMEISWLMTKAWNNGIHLFASESYEAAKSWCEMGLRFLKSMTTLKSSYEFHMNKGYCEILAKVTPSEL